MQDLKNLLPYYYAKKKDLYLPYQRIFKHNNMSKHTFLAFDLGATSGRAVVGIIEGDNFEMQEIHRFPNAIMELHGKYYWNIYSLYEEIKKGLSICVQKGIKPQSIGIDTWGVDFGYIAKDGTILGLPRAYRDPYTANAPEEFFSIVPCEELYRRTGIQIMNFNSLFQLYAAKRENSQTLAVADKILFMPDLLAYMLTGRMVCEYTEASTSQLIDPDKKCFDTSLLESIGLNSNILLPIVMPGTAIGNLCKPLAEETGTGEIPVYAVAGHDTASAIAAIPATDDDFAYLSSGTWSLMGIESEEPVINEDSMQGCFTNEGGIDGTTCLLRNITGMWLLEQCRKEWEKAGRSYSYSEIVALANDAEPFRNLINPDDKCFANPTSMTTAIDEYCKRSGQPSPQNDAEYIRCIFESLALCYKETLATLRNLSPHPINRLHIIGGGSKNSLLNQFTANALGIPVLAGPSEATAIGNCMVQAMAAGLVNNRNEMRNIINRILPPQIFIPQNCDRWKEGYTKYKTIVK